MRSVGGMRDRKMRTTAALTLYRGLSEYPGPLVARWVLERRARRGKEDPARLGERFGRASLPRPEGRVAWFHAASVGESLSLLPLLERLRAVEPDLSLLVTTGTRTAAQLMAERLPPGAAHQYAPVDTAPAVRAFLAHWRPCLLGIVESEIWPTMLSEARRSGAATALLSARLSEKSAATWAYAPRSIDALLGGFDVILAQTETIAARLCGLGAAPATVRVAGSLKDAAAPLPADVETLARWRERLAGRPVWIAASTHPGDEAIALAAHRALLAQAPGLATVIAPRHPERAAEAAAAARAAGAPVVMRSAESAPDAAGGVLIVDRLGELGLWYRLAQAALVCGSFSAHGGHNPMEPARLGRPVLFGPDMASFETERARLIAAGGGAETAPERLAADLAVLLAPGGATSAEARRRGAAAKAAADGGAAALERHLEALQALLQGVA